MRDVVDRCLLVDLPLPLSEADYAQAASELQEGLLALPEVIGVYATGSVSSPGISDLDRIAVADAPVTAEVWDLMSPRTRTVSMHTPFLVDRATFERHRWFAHLEPLRLVGGEAIEVEEPGDGALLERLLALEGLVIALLKIHKQLGTGRIKVRATLCLLHSLRHSLELGRISESDAAEAWRLVQDVGALRNSWFSLEPDEAEERLRVSTAAVFGALPEVISRLGLPPGMSDARPPPAIRLPVPWATCTLVPSGAGRGAVPPPRPTPSPLNRSRRLTEAHWRMRRFHLELAAPAFDLLALNRHADGSEPLRERGSIVDSYQEYLGASSGPWSAIGFAHSFVAG